LIASLLTKFGSAPLKEHRVIRFGHYKPGDGAKRSGRNQGDPSSPPPAEIGISEKAANDWTWRDSRQSEILRE
jgi:hypothetical protein